MKAIILLVVGFALLVWGADKFVAGASAAARRLGVPSLLVGLTIVAFGTSAPELAVSVTAALRGANEIAVGNVVGSNIFNLLVVAGLSAVVIPLVVSREIVRRDWPLSIGAAVVLLVMLARGNDITRAEGIVLLILFAAVMTAQIRAALHARVGMEQEEEPMRTPYIVLQIALGLVCIIAGGQLSVDGATGLARALGLSETLIGLTIVAIGTSLPELVTSLAAARKGENDIAMGNVIGSNLFNILFILGTSAVLRPITVAPTAIIDGAVLVAVSVVFWLTSRRGKMSRPVGAVMMLSYVAYTAYLILR